MQVLDTPTWWPKNPFAEGGDGIVGQLSLVAASIWERASLEIVTAMTVREMMASNDGGMMPSSQTRLVARSNQGISSLLRAMREAEGVGQSDLAALLELGGASTISLKENGRRGMTVEQLYTWGDTLGYDIHVSAIKRGD